MRVHPACQVILEVGFTTQFAQLLKYAQFDFSTEVQFVFIEHGIIARQHNLLKRHIVFFTLVIVNPTAQHHAAILTRMIRVTQVLGIHVIDVDDARILDIHATHSRLVAEVHGVHLQIIRIADNILQTLLLQNGSRFSAHNNTRFVSSLLTTTRPVTMLHVRRLRYSRLLVPTEQGNKNAQQQQCPYNGTYQFPVERRTTFLAVEFFVEQVQVCLANTQFIVQQRHHAITAFGFVFGFH